MRICLLEGRAVDVGDIVDWENGVEEDEEGRKMRQAFGGDECWHATRTWVGEEGVVRSRHYNAWSRSWEWGQVRHPTLGKDGALYTYAMWQGKSRRMRLERAVALAWVSRPPSSRLLVAAKLNKADGCAASNIGWVSKSRAEKHFDTKQRRHSSSCPPRISSERWAPLRYVMYDTANDACARFVAGRHGPHYVSCSGWLKDGEGRRTRGHRCSDGHLRASVPGLGLVRIDSAVMFSFKGEMPFQVRHRDGNVGNAHVGNLSWDASSLLSERFRGSSSSHSCFDLVAKQGHSVAAAASHLRVEEGVVWTSLYEAVLHRSLSSIPSRFWEAVVPAPVRDRVSGLSGEGNPLLGCRLLQVMDTVEDLCTECSIPQLRLARLYARKTRMLLCAKDDVSRETVLIESAHLT